MFYCFVYQESFLAEENVNMRKKFFVIGDSISWYYGQYLSKMLAPFADYDRKGGSKKMTELADMTDGVNGGHSGMVLIYVKGVLNKTFFKNSDYLVLNCGIHDTKIMPETGKIQIDPETYRKNLESIISIAPMPIIWVTTTPFNLPCGDFAGRQQNIDLYNKAALEIMAKHKIPVIDLDNFTRTLGTDIYLNGTDPCHFNDAAQALQAAFICGQLLSFIR